MSRSSITWPCTGCISSSLSRYLAKNTNAPGEQLISRVLSRVSRTGLLQGPPGRALDYPGGRHHRRDPRNHPGCNRHLGPKDQMLPGMGRGGGGIGRNHRLEQRRCRQNGRVTDTRNAGGGPSTTSCEDVRLTS